MTKISDKKQTVNSFHDSYKSDHVSFYTIETEPKYIPVIGLDIHIVRRIFTLAWPVIIGMLTQTAINTVDLLFVGRLPDQYAIPGTAGILSSIVLLWAFGGFLSAIAVGTQAVSARRYSEGKFGKAGQVLTNSLAISIIASIFLTFVAQHFVSPLMSLLTPSESVQEIGSSYSYIRFFGLLNMGMMASYKSFYDGIGRVRVHMTIAIIMNLSNITLCYLLIFGFSIGSFVVAPMYVDGAAWGSVISGYIGITVMILWSFRKKDRKRYGVYSWKNLNLNIAGVVARLSFWSGIATVVLMAGVGLFNHIVGLVDEVSHSSDVNASCASIVIHVMMLVFMTSLAFGTATATLVSQSIGAKKPQLAKRYCWQSVRLAVYAMSLFGIFAIIAPHLIMQVFLPADLNDVGGIRDKVIATAIPSLRLAAGALSPISAAGLVLVQALYGAGETKYVMIVEFVLHFGILVPLAYIFSISMGFDLMGCWFAAIIYASALMVATGYKFKKADWSKNHI